MTNKPLTKEMANWTDEDGDDISYYEDNGKCVKLDDVRSAVEGLNCVRYFFIEDGRNCNRCSETRFTWAIPNKTLPNTGRHDLEMCAFCWNKHWFPVFANKEVRS